MKSKFILLIFLSILSVFIFSGCEFSGVHNILLNNSIVNNLINNRINHNKELEVETQNKLKIEEMLLNESMRGYEQRVRDSYNKKHNITYIARMKNYFYPLKVAVVEFVLPNTTYVSDTGKSFINIINNKNHTMNFLLYNRTDKTNTYLGNMTPLKFEIEFNRREFGVNLSYLKFEDFYTHSLRYVEDYMRNEYERITGVKKDILVLKIFGPYEINSILNKNKTGFLKKRELENQFNIELNKTGINFSKYDVIGVVFFDDNRFEHAAFRSFADVKNSRFYVQFPANQGNIDEGLEAFSHEFLHILGATDKYNTSDKFAARCLKSGIANPKEFGGDVSCIMCGSIRINETSGLTPNYLSESKVCDLTAKEIGWT